MRVLHVQRVAGLGGGSERHLAALLPSLADHGIDVRMLVLDSDDAEPFVRYLRSTGISVRRVPGGRDADPRTVARIVREIRAFDPDIVHTHLVHADTHGQVAARMTRRRGVSSMHGTHPFFTKEPTRSAARVAGRLAARTIAISAWVARFLDENRQAPLDRIRTVLYGIDAAPWTTDEGARVQARESLGVARDAFVVGVASRLVPHKGHDVLLGAAAKARRAVPSVEVLVAGTGPIQADLERTAARTPGLARFLGFVEDMPTFMAACDAVAFPTSPAFGEGFGLAALEAQAAGRPVIGTNVASLPEVVEDGKTGLLVAPDHEVALAGAIELLGKDVKFRRRLGIQARERVVESFSLDRMAEDTIAVYREAVA